MTRYYIGLAATFHDSAMAIVDENGDVLFAEAAERYLQDKRAFNCPPDHFIRVGELVAKYCGTEAELVLAVSWSQQTLDTLRLGAMEELSIVRDGIQPLTDAWYADEDHRSWPFPNAKWLRAAMLHSIGQAGVNISGHRGVPNPVRIRRYDHHLTHAAMACYSSPFDDALCAVIDGYGEGAASAFYRYEGGRIRLIHSGEDWYRPDAASLGQFYAMLCGACGFDALKGEEWKVMGLAAYGKVVPRLYKLLAPMVAVDGFDLRNTLSPEAYRERVQMLASEARPRGSSPLRAADLARTGQQVFADTLRKLLTNLHGLGESQNLVFGGGCALNSSYNGRIARDTGFARVHIPSAPGDDGNAVGAALLACHEDHPSLPPRQTFLSPFLGTEISQATLANLAAFGGLRKIEKMPGRAARKAAELIAEGKIIGWMQGRAEFGPRALGNRSIVADPRRPDMKATLNARVKFREEFRPFAPSILHEHGPEYFDDYQETPYMERALAFRRGVRRKVPAVVHQDGTGRPQSVTAEGNPKFHALVSHFRELTGVPLVLNTSFNVMGKPIIHSVEDAVGVFFTSGLDALVIDDYVIEK